MATEYLGTSALAAISAQQPLRGGVICGKYVVGAALVINDTINMAKLKAGALITSIYVDSPDLDSNVPPALVFDVQLKTATTKYITGATVGQAAGRFGWPAVVVAATGGTIGAGAY